MKKMRPQAAHAPDVQASDTTGDASSSAAHTPQKHKLSDNPLPTEAAT